MRSSALSRAWQTALLSLGLTAAALLYPEGTVLDRSARGYSWSQNFLSDLGMTVAYDGHPNVGGALCFVVGLCALVLGLGRVLGTFVRRYAKTPAARRLAFASSAAPWAAVVTWTLLSAALAVYAALLARGPALDTPARLAIYVVGQKLAALVVVLAALFQTAVADRALPHAAPRATVAPRAG